MKAPSSDTDLERQPSGAFLGLGTHMPGSGTACPCHACARRGLIVHGHHALTPPALAVPLAEPPLRDLRAFRRS
jgi:hypothetical protein